MSGLKNWHNLTVFALGSRTYFETTGIRAVAIPKNPWINVKFADNIENKTYVDKTSLFKGNVSWLQQKKIKY